MKKKMIWPALLTALMLCACGETKAADPAQDNTAAGAEENTDDRQPDTAAEDINTAPAEEDEFEEEVTDSDTEAEITDPDEEKEEESMKDPVLLYMGHASLRIVSGDDKVIYIDPFCGEGYDLPADLILQTHDHYDHKDLSKVSLRNDDCVVITQKEALSSGKYNSFDMGYVSIEAVEAYNKNHDRNKCVGYILTFENGVSLYVSGDTSKTDQMQELSSRDLDYALYCCDGVYNMGAAEAAECAALVGAKVNIPYHSGAADVTLFDMENAGKFNAPGAEILTPRSELILSKP